VYTDRIKAPWVVDGNRVLNTLTHLYAKTYNREHFYSCRMPIADTHAKQFIIYLLKKKRLVNIHDVEVYLLLLATL